MSLADEMRAKTEEGRKAREDEARRKAEERRLRREAVMVEARDNLPTSKDSALAQIKSAADGGHNSTTYYVGEISELNTRGFRSDYIHQLRHLLMEELRQEGFIVRGCETVQRPIGSDPYRLDTYTEMYIEISW